MLHKILVKSTLSIILIVIMSLPGKAQTKTLINYSRALRSVITERDLNADNLSVIIDKSDHKLTILSDTVILKEYPVVFGKNPVDDKLKQGDRCTPEGTFYMKAKYPHSKWSKFIWLNYPTQDSWRKHNAAIRQGKIPGDAKIGGEIGIHGVPDGMDILIDMKYDWTEGCISLKTKDINELYYYVNQSTPIIIKK
ncbi:MAG TPA: L,D-transpeptidase [Bacteroidales bacterium]|nr:L,D-transpeptidase [Bacteroidales bacterium]